MNRFRLAAIAVLPASLAAWAGPPFVTDDPEPVEFHKWEINTAINGAWGDGQASVGAPTVDINYGALPNVQLHAQPRYSFVKDEAGKRHGLDDTEIGIKYRFLDVTRGDAHTMAGVYPMYQLPTGARRLGEDRGRHQVFLPVWLQEEVGKWTFYGGMGYRFNRAPEGRNSTFAGGVLLYAISESLHLGGELFEESANAAGGARTRGGNLGGSLELSKAVSLLFSAGRSRSEITQTLAYIGLQTRF